MTLAIKAKKCLDSPLKGEKLFMIMLVHSPLFANLLFKNYVLCLCDALESCTYLLHNIVKLHLTSAQLNYQKKIAYQTFDSNLMSYFCFRVCFIVFLSYILLYFVDNIHHRNPVYDRMILF